MADYADWIGIDRGHEKYWNRPVWMGVLTVLNECGDCADYLNENSVIYSKLDDQIPQAEWHSIESNGLWRSNFRDAREPWSGVGVISFDDAQMKLTDRGRQLLSGEKTFDEIICESLITYSENNENPFAILAEVFLCLPVNQGLSINDIVKIMRHYRPNTDDDLQSVLMGEEENVSDTGKRRVRHILRLMTFTGAVVFDGGCYYAASKSVLKLIISKKNLSSNESESVLPIDNGSPDEMKREFEEFLVNVAKNRKGKPLAPTSVRNCLLNIQKNKDFIKSIEIGNIYEISSVDEILQIQEELSNNEDYKEENRDKVKGNGYYSHSLEQYKKFLIYRKEIKIDIIDDVDDEVVLPPLDPPTQIIYYGVPGCGKSNKIKEDLKDVPEYNKIRVVFHPEYTNADFMGQILPVVNGGISYKFTPGPFAQIIKRAYLNPNDKFYLVIEEINRGNAAAIFGDTFQLLDRLKPGKTDSLGNDPASPNVNTFTEGWSQYFVQNIDVNDYIRNVVEDNGKYKEPSDLSNTSRLDIKIGSITFTKNTAIRLPPNLSIWATMNTSDQNVFTLDNAFQRRFDMQLIRNEFEKGEDSKQFGGYKDADVQTQHDAPIAGTSVIWGVFWEWINKKIVTTLKGLSSTEDKRLGVWFVSNVDGKIDKKVFAEKVLKYLWDDAFKFKRPQIFAPEIDTLERLIAAFENPEQGKNPFEVFKDFSNLVSLVAALPQNNGAANQ